MNTKHTYSTGWRSACGQPANGCKTFTSKKAALKEARDNKQCLIQGAGGDCWCEEHCNCLADPRTRTIWRWTEHVEGGFFTATPKHPDYWH